MNAYFNIYQSSTEPNRPPISYKIREYLIQFVTKNVLREKGIIVNGNWNVILAIIFVSEGPRFKIKNIVLAKGGPRIIKEEKIKLYEVIIPMAAIEDAENQLLKTIELMYEAIKTFFVHNYKRVTGEYMDHLWDDVDLKYLLSLPYPAPFEQQKYVGDTETFFSEQFLTDN